MKIIDLLNKIANGEEVPKKIKIGDYYYEYYERLENLYNYKKFDIDNGKYLDDYLCDTYFLDNNSVLNDEVEVIEDKKIEHLENYVDFANLKDDEKFDYLYEMESRIIDRLNGDSDE